MLFNFCLRPVDDIVPWRCENQFILHWFGLTDGCYWMDVGTDDLFRYTNDILERWGLPQGRAAHSPYLDYQVARLWEDLQEMLPFILEPVPDYVLQHVGPDTQIFAWWKQRNDRLDSEKDIPEST